MTDYQLPDKEEIEKPKHYSVVSDIHLDSLLLSDVLSNAAQGQWEQERNDGASRALASLFGQSVSIATVAEIGEDAIAAVIAAREQSRFPFAVASLWLISLT